MAPKGLWKPEASRQSACTRENAFAPCAHGLGALASRRDTASRQRVLEERGLLDHKSFHCTPATSAAARLVPGRGNSLLAASQPKYTRAIYTFPKCK